MTRKCARSATWGASQCLSDTPLGVDIRRKSYCRPVTNKYDAGSGKRKREALTNEGRCDVQTRLRRLHIETHDGFVQLDILSERTTRKERNPSLRSTLNAPLHQTVTSSARHLGTGSSSASSQSKCGANAAGTTHLRGSAQVTAHGGRQTKIEISERD